MKRKTYYHKGMNLVRAINKQSGTNTGKSLAHFRDFHREAPQLYGSYQGAWDSEPMKFARRFYLGEDC